MGIADRQTQQKFPFPYDTVFDGLLVILPRNWSWTLKSHDRNLGRITVSTAGSFFSYGENMTIKLEKIDAENTIVTIESSLKIGMNIAAAHRHAKNFDSIISGLSHYLQHEKDNPVTEVEPADKPRVVEYPIDPTSKKRLWIGLGVAGMVVCAIVGIAIYVQSKERLKKSWKQRDVPLALTLTPAADLVAIGHEKEVEVVDVSSGMRRDKFPFPFKIVRSIAFSPDAALMAIGGEEMFGRGNFTIWDVQARKLVQSITTTNGVDSVSFSPDGKLLAYAASDKMVRLINIDTGFVEELSGHTEEVLMVAFSASGDVLISSGADKTVKIWNLPMKKVIREIKDSGVKFALSADGKLLAVNGTKPGVINLLDLETGRLQRTVAWDVPDKFEIRKISFFDNSKLLAVGGGEDFEKPGEIRLYETETGNLKQVLKGHQGMVLDFSIARQKPLLISTGVVVKSRSEVFGEVNVWNIADL